jgi:hypothetical protein
MIRGCWLVVVTLALTGVEMRADQPAPALDVFHLASDTNDSVSARALGELSKAWRDAYTPMFIDMARLLRRAPARPQNDELSGGFDDETGDVRTARGTDASGAESSPPIRRESIVRSRLLRFLERQTGQRFGDDLNAWREWMWKLPADFHPQYAEFKGAVYGRIDPRFRAFFPPGTKALIRLDEIDWGGVMVNGIPPLNASKVLAAADATYLRDGHVVFGIVVNGEARAYPKRILAWHEMANDRVGGIDLTIVYCTLCGTVIPYESHAGGERRRFGTSGLLYRSNKLMFDEGTKSLWSTLEGKPVVGPLAESALRLVSHAAVTTTWGEWRASHPDTTVLSLETGHKRDYSEGAAYRDYFATDDLYFRVSHVDRRLKNKAEVLTMRVVAAGKELAVAISADFLKRHPVYDLHVGGERFVVVTSPRGANRVYARPTGSDPFEARFDGTTHLMDSAGRRWHLTEESLTIDGSADVRFARVPAQRAFWFGWVAQFPDTMLIK